MSKFAFLSGVALVAVSMPAFAQDNVAEDTDVGGGEIIVTGTRAGGVSAAASAAPIKVLGSDVLGRVGQPNMNQVLTQLVPSFTAQSFGADAANLTLSARLRGLSPNHTLVLINGRRRHSSANFAAITGPYQGSAAADLDLISPLSIERIEVLEDGAAAQYGSDAIAGVINIILKDGSEGGEVSLTAGEHYSTGGQTYAGTIHLGTKIGEDGFINITGFHRFHDRTQVGGLDIRVTDQNGVLYPFLSPEQQALYANMAGFPFVNRLNGDARSRLTNLQYNVGYDLGGVDLYSFGSYSMRTASSFQNVRLPEAIVASSVLGVPGNLGDPDAIIFDPDGDNPPNGFNPREAIDEDDYAVTGGLRGDAGSLKYDLSATYGEDKIRISTLDTANASLFIDTHFTPTDFYAGSFRTTELTLNADFSHEFEVGFASPLNIAFGAEYRRNSYEIGQGEDASFYKEGPQAFPGFRPTDAGLHKRNNKAVYLDIASQPTEELKLDAAVRYEHYSDFGSNVSFKATGRYDFTSAFALRGTVSTGFRAPTLQESFYSSTIINPNFAIVQLPPNSAAAKLVGFEDLNPEKSTNFSLGTVFRPAPRFTVTLDAYQIRIKNRILGSGLLFGTGGPVNFPVITDAIAANGNILSPTIGLTGISIFTNGADTRSRGADLVATYRSDLGTGSVVWSLSANYNRTKATRLSLAPAILTPPGGSAPVALFDRTAISNLEDASPRFKMVGSAFATFGSFSATLRGTVFGNTSQQTTPDGGATYYTQKVPSAFIGDVELNYDLTKGIQLSVGANNVFNKRPPTLRVLPNGTITDGNYAIYDTPLSFSPYGFNGGYYYARINVRF